MDRDKPPVEPKPEEFGMTRDSYIEAKAKHTREHAPKPLRLGFWLKGTLIIVGTLAAMVVASQWANPSSELIMAVGFGPLFIGELWVEIRGMTRKQELACRHPMCLKVRLYQEAVATYQLALARYNSLRQYHWRSLGGVALENELAALYRKLGYRVETTKATGDEGIDLILRKNGAIVLVQCKGHSRPIGVGAIRDLYGTLMHHKADRAILVCPVGFTQGVIQFVQGKPIDLVSAQEIVTMVDEADSATAPQPRGRSTTQAIR